MIKEKKCVKISEILKVCSMRFKDFLNLNVEHWAGQRNINMKQVNKLATHYAENYEKYGNFCIFHPLYVAQTKDHYYLVDGQHKWKALNIVLQTYYFDENDPSLEIPVAFVKNVEPEKVFLILNSNREQNVIHKNRINRKLKNTVPYTNQIGFKPLLIKNGSKNAVKESEELEDLEESGDIFEESEDGIDEGELLDDAFTILKQKYKNFGNGQKRPNINSDEIQSIIMIKDVIAKYHIKKAEELVNYFVKLDKEYRGRSKSFYIKVVNNVESSKKRERERMIENYKNLVKNQEMHMLGLFKSVGHPKKSKESNVQKYSNYWLKDLLNIINQSQTPLIQF